MPYATVDDFIKAFTLTEAANLTNLDRPSAAGQGEVDEAVLTRALEDASHKIDSYVAIHKGLANPPEFFTAQLRRCCCVYARDYLSIHGNDEVVRQHCEDCDRWLKDVRDGKISLGLDATDPSKQSQAGNIYVAVELEHPFTDALRGY